MNQRPLGYEPNELPDCSTPRRHLTKAALECQGVSRESTARSGSPLGGERENREDRVGDPRGAPGPGGLVLEARQPLGGKPGPPAADAFPVGPQGPGDGGIGEPGGGPEDDAGPPDEPARDPTPPSPALQGGALGGGQDDREGDLDRVGGHQEGAYTPSGKAVTIFLIRLFIVHPPVQGGALGGVQGGALPARSGSKRSTRASPERSSAGAMGLATALTP